MDRKDELKRERDLERGAAPDERTGDVLGLSGGPIAKTSDDPSTEYDPEAVAHRRARMHDAADELVAERTAERTPERTSGATGVDMGAGGTGTDVSGD